MKRVGIALLWMVAGVVVLLLFVPMDLFRQGDLDRTTAVKAQIDVLMTALDTYRSDVGAFPSEVQGLQALRTDPGVRGWSGPYLDKDVPMDPWGHSYRYTLVGGRPRISSPGGGNEKAIASDGISSR